MRLPVALSTLLILAGCGGNPQPAGSPPAPVSAEAAPAPVPGAPSPATTPGSADSSGAVSPADSLRAAVDSALDAAILAELEAGAPAELKPSAAPPTEDEAAVLRNLFDIDVANYADHERVRYYLDFFTTRGRERMGIWLNRMGQWEPMIRSQLISRGLPGDLAYLPLIESGYSNTAVSRSKAVGMWQFMRATARFYGLRVDRWVDERREPFRATSTAIRYLSDLTTRFGSPYLAAAAYNGGPGRVQRGLQRLDIPVGDDEDEEDLETAPDGAVADEATPPDARDAAFFTLADSRFLRRETKDYVPKLIAAAMIAKRPEKYGFTVTPRDVLRVDSITVPGATGLDVVARVSGGSLSVLRELNPHLLRSVTPPGRKSVVMVPEGTGPETERAIVALPASERVSALAHRVRAGETTTRIARRYGLTVAELRDFNPALVRRGPRVGETLRIPGLSRVKSLAAADERVARASSAARGTHRVRRGENLGLIARKYRVTVKQLQLWNGLGNSTAIRAGQVLRLRPRPAGNVRVAK